MTLPHATLQKCPQCGHKNPTEARFCGICGAVLLAPEPDELRESIPPRRAWELVTSSYNAIRNNFWGFFRLNLLFLAIGILFSIIPIIGGVVATAIITAAAVIAAMLVITRQNISAIHSIRAAVSRFLPILGVTILSFLALLLMTITIIGIPVAVYFAVRWVFLVQAVMVERLGIRAAFARSTELVRGKGWEVFGRLLLMAFTSVLLLIGLVLVWALLITMVTATIGDIGIVFAFVTLIAPLPFYSAWGVFVTQLYLDARVHREGYSSLQLSQALATYS